MNHFVTLILFVVGFALGMFVAYRAGRVGSSWRTRPKTVSEGEACSHVRVRSRDTWTRKVAERRFTPDQWETARLIAANNPDDERVD